MDKISAGEAEKFGSNIRKIELQRRRSLRLCEQLKKPAVEKRRRDRINRSLSHLKALLLRNIHRNGGIQTTKLDKADVLEMTVKYITMIQYKQPLVTMATNNKLNIGYTYSSRETARFQGNIPLCQNQVYDKTADDILRLGESADTNQPIQIVIPQTNELTPTSSIPMQIKAVKLETATKVDDQESMNDALDKNIDCETTNKMESDYSSSFHMNTSYPREFETSKRNKHEGCLRSEELKVWRPW